jgi:hydroxymethylbilane synthase
MATTPELNEEAARLERTLRGGGVPVALETMDDGAPAVLRALTQGRVRAALLRGRACIDLPDDLRMAAVLPREEPRDVLLPARDAPLTLPTLPHGARVGVRGVRRRGFLLAHRSDAEAVAPENGGGPGHALGSGSVDAVILGAAEARRLGLASRATEILDAKAWVPGPAQGLLVLLTRADDASAEKRCSDMEHGASRTAFRAEVAVLDVRGGAFDLPLGALAVPHGPWIRMWGMLASPDGTRVVRGDITGRTDDPEGAGRALTELLLARGAASLLSGDRA